MPVVQIVCPKCGGDVELEDSREFGFCMYCGTKIMISEMITQKIRIDESHKVDSWLSFCESDMSTMDYDSLEKHAEKILENDKSNHMGWYYKGVAQIGLGKFDGGYDSWIKSVQNCHDGKKLKELYDWMPDVVYKTTYQINSEWASKQDNTETNFKYASIMGICDVERAFEANDDFQIDDNDESALELIFSLFNKFKECFKAVHKLRMYYGMYMSLGELVEEIVFTYVDPEILLAAFEEAYEMGQLAIRVTSRPRDDYDLAGSIRWDMIDSDKIFYSIIANKMRLYLEDCNEDEIEKVAEYWCDKDLDYVDIYERASDISFNITDDSALARMTAKSKTNKLAEEFVDAFLGPIMTKKKKTGFFGKFKK